MMVMPVPVSSLVLTRLPETVQVKLNQPPVRVTASLKVTVMLVLTAILLPPAVGLVVTVGASSSTVVKA